MASLKQEANGEARVAISVRPKLSDDDGMVGRCGVLEDRGVNHGRYPAAAAMPFSIQGDRESFRRPASQQDRHGNGLAGKARVREAHRDRRPRGERARGVRREAIGKGWRSRAHDRVPFFGVLALQLLQQSARVRAEFARLVLVDLYGAPECNDLLVDSNLSRVPLAGRPLGVSGDLGRSFRGQTLAPLSVGESNPVRAREQPSKREHERCDR